MKRLRKEFGSGIRFFGCGEYGDVNGRPHYHLLLFNICLADKRFYKLARGGQRLYTSAALDRLWPYGFNVIGDVTFDSANYVAGYITKQVTGDRANSHYERVNVSTGEIASVQPEFVLMSRRPGIGSAFVEKYKLEIYDNDSVIVNAHEAKPPRFYDVKMEEIDAKRMSVIKRARQRAINLDENTPARRRVREKVVLRNRYLAARRDV
jgi:hypothetical protein